MIDRLKSFVAPIPSFVFTFGAIAVLLTAVSFCSGCGSTAAQTANNVGRVGCRIGCRACQAVNAVCGCDQFREGASEESSGGEVE